MRVDDEPAPGPAGTGEGTPAPPAPPSGPVTSTSTLKIMRAKSVQIPFMRSLNSTKASFLYATSGSIWANPRRWMPSRR